MWKYFQMKPLTSWTFLTKTLELTLISNAIWTVVLALHVWNYEKFLIYSHPCQAKDSILHLFTHFIWIINFCKMLIVFSSST